MNIVVIMKMVPDTVEELEVDSSGKRLDEASVRLIPAEQDEHALEQALIMKEKFGGTVTVLTLDLPGADDALFTALAKGASKAVKVSHGFEDADSRLLSGAYSSLLSKMQYDIVLTGTQAIDDLSGELGAILAAKLNLPYLGVAVKMQPDSGKKTLEVVKELGGGLQASYESPLPAVVGVQSAEKPPRYVPLMKVRNAMKTMKLEGMAASATAEAERIDVVKLYKPDVSGGAEMLSGSTGELAGKLMQIFKEKGVI